MRIHEIINEESHYAVDLHDRDSLYNPEADKIALQNQQVYKNRIGTPVFTKPEPQKYNKFSNKPEEGIPTSTGYRALQYVKKLAGLSYDKSVEQYQPGFVQSQNTEQFTASFNRLSI